MGRCAPLRPLGERCGSKGRRDPEPAIANRHQSPGLAPTARRFPQSRTEDDAGHESLPSADGRDR